MKTARVVIGLLVAVAIMLLFAGGAFAQRSPVTNEQYRQYCRDIDAYDKAERNDKDDPDWGLFDWRTRARNKACSEKFGYVRYEPKTLYEWLDNTRQIFKEAEASLTTKEQKDFLAVCQKMREAAIILSACDKFCKRAPEVSRAAYIGPFFSKEGRRDDQFMVQIFFVRAYDEYARAGEEYLKIVSKTSKKARAEVMMALFSARGKTYSVDFYKEVLDVVSKQPQADFPVSQNFLAYIYEYARNIPAQLNAQSSNAKQWKLIFEDLSSPGGKEWNAPRFSGFPMPDIHLHMDCGSQFNGLTSKMPSKAEFQFIWLQADQRWKDLLHPSEELLKDLPRFTYWQRDTDPDEPPLVLKVQVPPYLSREGDVGCISMHNHLPNSLFMGLTRTSESPEQFYVGHFAEQRSLWQRLPDESAYLKAKSGQEEWLKAHPTSDLLAYKLRLCANFEKLAPEYTDHSSFLPRFSLESLESLQQPVTVASHSSGNTVNP